MEYEADTDLFSQWGVYFDAPGSPNTWGIMTEVPDPVSTQRFRTFNLEPGAVTQEVEYSFAHGRRLGAQKIYLEASAQSQIKFSCWAPNAGAVSVVFGILANGYIDNNGGGIDPAIPVRYLHRSKHDVDQDRRTLAAVRAAGLRQSLAV